MCRFAAYIGEPLLLSDVLYKPKNSLIRQSIHARETHERLNGDGFGLGWYTPEILNEPTLFTSIQPAWSNRNLFYLASCVKTNCFFAHVRAASEGGISEFNCHPFHFQKFLFMHNGEVGGFGKIKRHIRHELRNEIYDWVKGQTDSEHFSALFLEIFMRENAAYTASDIANVLNLTINKIQALQKKYDVTENNYLNFAITDGKHMVLARYVSNSEEVPSTLHYSFKTNSENHNNNSSQKITAVLVASEKLDNHYTNWHDIPANHMILINEDLSNELREIK